MIRRNFTSILGTVATGLIVAGCGTESGSHAEGDDVGSVGLAVEDESQCGPSWDVQNVEQYNGALGVPLTYVQRHEGAVGFQLNPGCTGTMISDDLFISAGHCGYAVNDVVRFNYQNDPSGNPRPTQDFTVTQVVEQEDNASWDYAIVRLSGNPGAIWGYARLADRDEDVGDNVVIIQHPNGVPKVLHAGPVFDYASPLGANWFRHQVDTVGGSSGSGLLTEDGFLVGIHTNAGCNTSNPIDGNSAMRMTALLDHSTTLQNVLAWQRGAHGWVWADQASSASYTPSTFYQFNSAGATNTITRSSAGVYAVTFPNIGNTGITGNGRGGTVQVTAYSPGAYCKVASWSAFATNVVANIRCFNYAGSAVDARYVALYERSTFEGFADGRGTAGYVWSQSTTYAAPTAADALYSHNNADGTNTITQTGTGTYTVTFPDVDEFDSSMHVTAYGSDNIKCQVTSWGTTTVNVSCTNPAGAAANSRFTLSRGGMGPAPRLADAGNAGAYAWADQQSAATYTPSLSYQGNDMGGNLTIDRSAVGTYLVRIPHPGVSINSDAVLVTAYGGTGHQCLVNNWARLANETQANVRCFTTSGAAVDTRYTVSYLTSTPDDF